MAWGRDLPQTLREGIQAAIHILTERASFIRAENIAAEADQILAAALQTFKPGPLITRLEISSRLDDRLPEEAAKKLLEIALCRASGKPLQYCTGFQTFLDHDYHVESGVLIPRPETEILVVEAITSLQKLKQLPQLGLEMGIGSGILSVELISAFQDLRMLASEVSDVAVEIATQNAARILETRAKHLKIIQSDSYKNIFDIFETTLSGQKADFLISNPPYLDSMKEAEAAVAQYEPAFALFAPQGDPLFYYREIATKAAHYLEQEGLIFLEIPHERAQDIKKLFMQNSWSISLIQDLTGRERVLIGKVLNGQD